MRTNELTMKYIILKLLKALFGTNAASQPETFKLAKTVNKLVENRGALAYAYGSYDQDEMLFQNHEEHTPYHDLFTSPYDEICQSLQHVPQIEPTVGDRRYFCLLDMECYFFQICMFCGTVISLH